MQSWDLDLIPSTLDIDESIKRDILGSRRRILFVEGKPQSLDAPLFSLLFPDVSVVAKESCREVIQSTLGVRGAGPLHYVQAFGLIDNDRRDPSDLARLSSQGVFALDDYSVESIYYNGRIRESVAARHATITGHSHEEALRQSKSAALAAIQPHIRRLAERAVERAIRYEVERQLPTRPQIQAGTPVQISVDVAAAVQAEVSRLQVLFAAEDLESILKHYPVRETSALSEISKKLGFQGRDQYESAVRKLLIDDPTALQHARSLFGGLASNLVPV